jgi:hypothetical protein
VAVENYSYTLPVSDVIELNWLIANLKKPRADERIN